MNPRAAYAYQYYLKRGYSPQAAAGIAGNLQVESGFADDVITGARMGDKGTAFGLAQHRGPRLANLKKYAQDQGVDYRTLDPQLGFIDHEMRYGLDGGAGIAFQKLQTAKTPQEAAQYFMQHFERPNPDPAINHLAKRQGYADALYRGVPFDAKAIAAQQVAVNPEAVQSAELSASAPIAAAGLPTLNVGMTGAAATPAVASDPISGIFSLLAQQRQQPQPFIPQVQMAERPKDTRPVEEKVASTSQTPDAYLQRARRKYFG